MRLPGQVVKIATAPKGRAQCGAVSVEFLIALLPLLLMFLGSFQLALIAAARLVVQRAASTGARAASVVLDDDPRFYDGTPRRALRGARLEAIRRAAHLPLIALAAPPEPGDDALALLHAPQAFDRIERATRVSFPVAPGSEQTFEDWIPQQTRVTLRVTHTLPCRVPLGAWLVCAGPVTALRAEASFLAHGAPYLYASERGDDA